MDLVWKKKEKKKINKQTNKQGADVEKLYLSQWFNGRRTVCEPGVYRMIELKPKIFWPSYIRLL